MCCTRSLLPAVIFGFFNPSLPYLSRFCDGNLNGHEHRGRQTENLMSDSSLLVAEVGELS